MGVAAYQRSLLTGFWATPSCPERAPRTDGVRVLANHACGVLAEDEGDIFRDWPLLCSLGRVTVRGIGGKAVAPGSEDHLLFHPGLQNVGHDGLPFCIVPPLLAANLQIFDEIQTTWLHGWPQHLETGENRSVRVRSIVDHHIEMPTCLSNPPCHSSSVILIARQGVDPLSPEISPVLADALCIPLSLPQLSIR